LHNFVKSYIFQHLSNNGASHKYIFGRYPAGRAIRSNLFLPQAQHKKRISTTIPNANHHNLMSILTNRPQLRFPEFRDNWKENKLGEIATFSKGKGISKADIIEDGKTECIRYGELYTVYEETISEIKSKTNIELNKLVLSEANDVIIPASGETQIDIATASCVLKSGIALGGDLNIIKTKNNGVFLSYLLNSAKKQDIANLAQGISVVHLYSSQLSTLNISFPTLPEQTKIANFFTAIDQKIQTLKTKKTTLQQYKKGVMQQLFSQKLRFKDANGKAFADWEMKKLGEVLIEHLEKNKEGKNNEVFSVAKHKGVINQIEHLGRSFSAKEILHYKLIFPNDVVYTKSPTSEFPFGIIKQNLTSRTGVVSPLYGVFRPATPALGFIMHNYFNSWINVYNYLSPLVQKGAKNTMNINNDDFLNGAKLSLPMDEKEQTAIANFLSAIDEKINKTNTQITQTQQWKKGLLQRMFV
jgi:type I restriction enzyme, S subunit